MDVCGAVADEPAAGTGVAVAGYSDVISGDESGVVQEGSDGFGGY